MRRSASAYARLGVPEAVLLSEMGRARGQGEEALVTADVLAFALDRTKAETLASLADCSRYGLIERKGGSWRLSKQGRKLLNDNAPTIEEDTVEEGTDRQMEDSSTSVEVNVGENPGSEAPEGGDEPDAPEEGGESGSEDDDDGA